MRVVAIKRKSQEGVALLVFAFIVLVGATTLLVTRLNDNSNRFDRYAITQDYLAEAKRALIGWSVYHPDNPGMLLFPDRNGDGNYDGDSDCTTGAINDTLLLGRLPWKGQGNPCRAPQTGLNIESRDFLDQELWYAVSKNLLYESPNYPVVNIELLNNNNDWLTVRDKDGNVLSDRVAFIIISPGQALTGQNRSGAAPGAANYLDSVTIGGTTYSNADTDLDFIIYPESDFTEDTTDNFNDKLVYVTIDEFIDHVEERAINDLANLLTGYHSTYGVFPWLSSYANPKIELKQPTGSHTGSNNSAILTDSNTNFNQWGVTVGDTVWNITDGSTGIVSAVTDTTLSLSAGLRWGADNDFDEDDEYFVELSSFPGVFIGTATATAGNGLVLTDTGRDFEALKIRVGDILNNVTDGSAGVISAVTDTTLEVASLSGGASNAFAAFDAYRVSAALGRATANGGLTLTDSNAGFTSMGIQAGDIVINATDNSLGSINAITSDTQLDVTALFIGSSNTFSNNDYYLFPRYNESQNTRQGLLAFQQAGDLFATDFTLDWRFAASTVTNTGTSNNATYNSALEDWVQTSINNSGSITFTDEQAVCRWLSESIADCRGYISNSNFLTSTVTTTGTTNAFTDESTLVDSNTDFPNAGIKIGDLVYNYDDANLVITNTAEAGSSGVTLVDTVDFIAAGVEPRTFLVTNTTDNTRGIVQSVATNTLTVISLPGNTVDFSDGDGYTIRQVKTGIVNTAPATNSLNIVTTDSNPVPFTAGDEYRVLVATSDMSARAEAPTNIASFIVYDSDADFSEVNVGDAVTNASWGGYGTITATGINFNGPWFTYTRLKGGVYPDIFTGERYRIYHNYVDEREYLFNLKFSGGSNDYDVSGARKRDVCVGYGADCSAGSPTDENVYGNGVDTQVRIRDIGVAGTVVGVANVTLPTTATQGSAKISGLTFSLADGFDALPEWFVRNGWHRYFYITYSSGGDIPGNAGECTAGADCLTLNIDLPSDAGTSVITQDNIRALIVYSDAPLATQDRTDGTIASYYEGDPEGVTNENNNNDDAFFKTTHFDNADVQATDYNDRIKAAVSCPDGSGNLCWQ